MVNENMAVIISDINRALGMIEGVSYRAYSRIVELCIELIRQFYDLPRQFRITGQQGAEEFVSYTNAGLKPQLQGSAFGMDMGYRMPVFDIKISAQRKNVYTKVSQNEMAMQFFKMGFFNPQLADQATMCLAMMDFDGKEEILQKVSRNGLMLQKLQQYMQMALSMAQAVNPQMAQSIAQDMAQTLGVAPAAPVPAGGRIDLSQGDNIRGVSKEDTRTDNARARASAAFQPSTR